MSKYLFTPLDIALFFDYANFTLSDENYIEAYFRLVKLKLYYIEGCDYIRLKFKTLLKSCGYKRRTEKLVLRINRSLEKLKLECSLKCRKKCNIRKIDLDDMIIILSLLIIGILANYSGLIAEKFKLPSLIGI